MLGYFSLIQPNYKVGSTVYFNHIQLTVLHLKLNGNSRFSEFFPSGHL